MQSESPFFSSGPSWCPIGKVKVRVIAYAYSPRRYIRSNCGTSSHQTQPSNMLWHISYLLADAKYAWPSWIGPNLLPGLTPGHWGGHNCKSYKEALDTRRNTSLGYSNGYVLGCRLGPFFLTI
jgi:hypothetical protein